MAEELRLDDLLGREVLAANGRRVGHLEEFHAETRGGECRIVEYVIGAAGLLERLDLGARLLVGKKAGGYLARWDQIDFSNPEKPRLTCAVEDLRRI